MKSLAIDGSFSPCALIRLLTHVLPLSSAAGSPGATNPNEALECPAYTHLLAMLTTCNPHAARDLMLGEEAQEDAEDSVRSVLMALLLFLTLVSTPSPHPCMVETLPSPPYPSL